MISERVDLTENRQFSRNSSDSDWKDVVSFFSRRKYPWSVKTIIGDYDSEFSQSDRELASDMVLTGSKEDRRIKRDYREDYLYSSICDRCGCDLDYDYFIWNFPNIFKGLCRNCARLMDYSYAEYVRTYKDIDIQVIRERRILYERASNVLYE